MSENEERSTLVRTGISLDENLLKKFDEWIASKGFANRSDALRFLIRSVILRDEAERDKKQSVLAALVYFYNHHQFETAAKVLSTQHDFEHIIVATMHTHVSHEYCFEVIIMKGKYKEVKYLSDLLLSMKGVLTGNLFFIPESEILTLG